MESRRPKRVQALERPSAYLRAQALAFLRFETPDLRAMERFLGDFGLMTVQLDDRRLVMRGGGTAPCLYVATRRRRFRYVGAAFVLSPDSDLRLLPRRSAARMLDPDDIPGGGHGVEVLDPAGHAIWLLTERPEVEAELPGDEVLSAASSSMMGRAPGHRGVNSPYRPQVGPSRVKRLGHIALCTTRFSEMADWYMRHLGLLPSEIQYLSDGTPVSVYFRLNLRDAPTDHHTVVLHAGLDDCLLHSGYEFKDLDALGQGQQFLRARGYRHVWGMGRHLLGGQLFDYWGAPDRSRVLRFADGDLLTHTHPPHYSPFAAASAWAWGPDVPPEVLRGPGSRFGRWVRAMWLSIGGRMTRHQWRLHAKAVAEPARPWPTQAR